MSGHRVPDSWTCAVCTYIHTHSSEATYLACAVCGADRPPADADHDVTHTSSDDDDERGHHVGGGAVTTATSVAHTSTAASIGSSLDRDAVDDCIVDRDDGRIDGDGVGSVNPDDLAFVTECCGDAFPLETVTRALQRANGSVEKAIEMVLSSQLDEALALEMHEAELAEDELIRGREEADRHMAESLEGAGASCSAQGGRSRRRAKGRGTALWTGGSVVRQRQGSWSPARPSSTPAPGLVTVTSLQQKFADEFDLMNKEDEHRSVEDLRAMQRRLKQKQIQQSKKAAVSYRAKSLTASAHSAESGRLRAEHESLTHAVVHAIVREHNTAVTIVDRLDLHGLFVSEALDVVDRYLEIHHDGMVKHGRQYPVRKFICVTGRGKNSTSGARLRPALTSWLLAHRIPFRDATEGSLEICIRALHGS
eukprot:m.175016 g.175016  ORF g.175016 m.175016 type:complete len:423 (+) comp13914_c0_seq1:349-1617(+)